MMESTYQKEITVKVDHLRALLKTELLKNEAEDIVSL
jgi:hypothetical protein